MMFAILSQIANRNASSALGSYRTRTQNCIETDFHLGLADLFAYAPIDDLVSIGLRVSIGRPNPDFGSGTTKERESGWTNKRGEVKRTYAAIGDKLLSLIISSYIPAADILFKSLVVSGVPQIQ
jgi:hypothetical protein